MEHEEIIELKKKMSELFKMQKELENGNINEKSLTLEQINNLNLLYAIQIEKRQESNRMIKIKVMKEGNNL